MVGSPFWTARTTITTLAAALSLGAGDLLAQAIPPNRDQDQTRRSSAQRRQFFDRVEGIIGDQVILRSTIEEELRAIETGSTPMTRSEREQRFRIILTQIAQEEIWVQYGKVIGGQDPEEFAKLKDRYVADKMTEHEQRFGSFSRFNEELGNIGESRSTLETQIRTRLLSDIGKFNALGQHNQRSSLMITPKAMRRYFNEHPEQFSIQNEAEYEWMRFASDAEGVADRMAAAIEAWAVPGADAGQIAEQFGGRFSGLDRLSEDPDDHHAEVLKRFALNATVGEISEPILTGRYYRLLKVTQRIQRRDESFSDVVVHERILRFLQDRQMRQAQNRVIQKNSAKLLIWPASLRAALVQR